MRDIFFGPEDIKLHGVVSHSETPGAPAAIICHPHPQFGGTMNNNVVLGIEKEIVDAGFTAMRFNFRGVGRSGGSFDGGEGERDDVRRAVDALSEDAAVGRIIIVGYSFGALAGLPVALEDERVAAAIGISPPTVMAPFDYLPDFTKPLLVAVGSSDEFADGKKLKGLVRPPHGRFELLPGVDHFYIGQELRVGEMAAGFIQRLQRDSKL